jgi:Fur family ferric uptake transcriptional regulator
MTTKSMSPKEELEDQKYSPAEDVIAQVQETFRTYLAQNGLRVTNQRMAILDAIQKETEHFTAEELLEKARRLDESVSRATVYRTLPILTESGLVREVDVGKDFKYYLTNFISRTEQAQIVCLDCDRIHEVDAPFMEWYGNTVAQKLGLIPESQRLQVNARCQRLRDLGQCSNHQKRGE